MRTMTFSEVVENTPNLYPTNIDDGLKQTIYDWFQFRHVVDNNRFVVYFKRVLNRDYERYNQLLRIEPGVAQYDWLVENYLERQVVVAGNTSSTVTSSNTGSKTNVRTNDLTETSTGTDERTISNDGEDGVHRVETGHGTDSEQRGGSDVVANSGTDTTTTTNTNVVDGESTSNTSHIGSESNTRTGSETTERDYEQDANAVTERLTYKNLVRQLQTENGSADATKAGPMDASVVSNTSPTPGSPGDVDVDFGGHASQIKQSHESSISEESWSGSPDKEVVNVNPYSYDDDTTHTYNITDNHSFSNDRADNTSSTNDVTTTDNGSSSIQHGLRSQTTYGATSDTERDTEVVVDETTSYGKVTTDNNQSTTTGRSVGTVTDESSDEGSSSQISEQATGTDTKEVLTGRQKDPADILERVVSFVMATNAWEWLEARLEVCFMSCYDI